MKIRTSLAAVIAGILLTVLVLPPVFANRGPGTFDFPGTWTIEYFQDAGYATPWVNYATDGSGIGGASGPSPLVGSGQTIYVKIKVSGSTPNAYLWYEIDGGNPPYPGPANLCQLNGSGNSLAGGCLTSWTNNLTSQFRAGMCTVPEKIALMSSGTPGGNDFDGHIADHLLAGSQTGTVCAPGGVPEMPISGPLLIATALPLLMLLRRHGNPV